MSKEKSKHTSTHPDGDDAPVSKGSHVYLIDGSGYIFRAFFQGRRPMRDNPFEFTNGIFLRIAQVWAAHIPSAKK